MWFNGYGEFVGEGEKLNRWIGWDLARFNGERLFGTCLIFEGRKCLLIVISNLYIRWKMERKEETIV